MVQIKQARSPSSSSSRWCWWLSSLSSFGVLWSAVFATLYFRPSEALTLTTGERIASRVALSSPPSRTPQSPQPSQPPKHYKTSLFDLPAVEKWGTEHGWKEHHLQILYRCIMKDVPTTIDTITNSTVAPNSDQNESVALAARLIDAGFPKRYATPFVTKFALTTSSIVRVEKSDSSGGYKFVIQLSSGQLMETVLIRHTRTNNKRVRYTVCVSSQVGCARHCSFCATGTMGLLAHLTSGEILEQVYWAQQYLASVAASTAASAEKSPTTSAATARSRFRVKPDGMVRNVVFMGMGEPLDNYEAVHEALRGLTHQYLFQLGAKHLTVSTVGASARILRMLADDVPQVNLAVSLHSALQESRELLIPSAKSTSLLALGAALDYHARQSGRGAMLEYLLIADVNDRDVDVTALADFCHARNVVAPVFVNLIPYNPTLAGMEFGYTTPSDDRIYAFHHRLQACGIASLVRWSSAAGRETQGACGQLALTVVDDAL